MYLKLALTLTLHIPITQCQVVFSAHHLAIIKTAEKKQEYILLRMFHCNAPANFYCYCEIKQHGLCCFKYSLYHNYIGPWTVYIWPVWCQ